MRRLPVYFLIDVSESMVGKPMDSVDAGLRDILSQLKRDPYALETVWVSVIVFAGKAKVVTPLTELMAFYPPKLNIGAGTSYDAGFKRLIQSMDSEVNFGSADAKGDWKPLVVFISDGVSTDHTMPALDEWRTKWKQRSDSVSLAIGKGVDLALLDSLANQVLKVEDAESGTDGLEGFFRWVTNSISANSKSLGLDGQAVSLGGPEELRVEVSEMEEVALRVDEQHAIFHGKCQGNAKDYIVKYSKGLAASAFAGLDVEVYRLAGSFAVGGDYRELSQDGLEDRDQATISTENLRGVPNCPVCENSFAMCSCQCGGIFCLDGPGVQTCPHCGTTSEFVAGDGHIDLNRKQG